MRSLFAALILVGSSLVLAACDNGNKDSTSGGGSTLDVSGVWFVQPDIKRTTTGFNVRPYHVVLGQTGLAVTSTNGAYDPALLPNSCDTADSYALTGRVAGNTFSGKFIGSYAGSSTTAGAIYSEASFTVTGTSNTLSGRYSVFYNSGPCIGGHNGTVTMRRQ